MPYQTRLPEALARFGLKVELVPGWQTRGGSTLAPRGAVAHWTAGPKGTTTRPSLNICTYGRTGLPGPLCNVYLDRNGIAVVVAAGTANHAGVGGWRGLTGNSQVFGTEAECGGDGDWTTAQRDAYPRINAAYAWLAGFGPEMVCGHHEWAPTRKIDIRDWPMSAMRTQVAAILNGDADMPLTPADAQTILKAPIDSPADPRGDWGLGDRVAAMDRGLADLSGMVRAFHTEILAAVRGGTVSPEKVAQALAPQVIAGVQSTIATSSGDVDEATVLAALRTFFADASK